MIKHTLSENTFLGEKSYNFTLDNGLKIIVTPKPGYTKKCAIFGVNFGSTTNTFKSAGKSEITTIPDGVAHFLEHKLFESEEGDAFTQYAKTGASANAYTSFTTTAYYFTCTDKFNENLKILTNLMQTPYFTKENVAKEQGIIGQEINMYLDNPGWRVYFNMLEAMYNTHPVKKDIAGSVESIAKITPELLYDCYNKFYTPENAVLSICGDLDPFETAEYAASLIKKLGNEQGAVRICEEEADKVMSNNTVQSLSVSRPLFHIGFKDNNNSLKGEDFSKKDIVGRMALDIVFGKSSSFFDKNYNSGIINDSFEFEYSCEKDYSHSILSGESETPEKVRDAILTEIKNVCENGISDEDFNRHKNVEKSMYIKQWVNIESTARNMMNAHFAGYNFYNILNLLDKISKEDILNQVEALKENLCVTSVIKPNKE